MVRFDGFVAARDNLRFVQSSDKQQTESWTRNSVLVAIFFACFLGIQIFLPIVRLTATRPARFGWQMWSARRRPTLFFVVMTDGTTRPADLSRYIGWSRGELKLTERLPPHLCRVIPDLLAVHIQPPGSETRDIYSCR